MGMTYELWRALMYGVGVFVTCNAGGYVLRRVASGLDKSRAEAIRDDARERAAAPEPMESVTGTGGQSFEDMRRQTEAGRNADAAATA